MLVKISWKFLKQLFVPCNTNFIRDVCGASCCDSSIKGRIVVSILDVERARIEALGGVVINGALIDKEGKCPFKNKENLCSLHSGGLKPFGCLVSPFVLNKNSTLIVRNRYRLFKCYRNVCSGKLLVYEAHRKSLEVLFGVEGFLFIRSVVELEDDFYMDMDDKVFQNMKETQKARDTMIRKKRLRIKKDVVRVVGVEKSEIGNRQGFFGSLLSRSISGILEDRFIVPPFSVFDSKQGYWQKRKREWLSLGIRSELGRGEMNPGSPGDNRHDPAMSYKKRISRERE